MRQPPIEISNESTHKFFDQMLWAVVRTREKVTFEFMSEFFAYLSLLTDLGNHDSERNDRSKHAKKRYSLEDKF